MQCEHQATPATAADDRAAERLRQLHQRDAERPETVADLEADLRRLENLARLARILAQQAVTHGDAELAKAEMLRLVDLLAAQAATTLRIGEHEGWATPGDAARFETETGRRPSVHLLRPLPPRSYEL